MTGTMSRFYVIKCDAHRYSITRFINLPIIDLISTLNRMNIWNVTLNILLS